MSAREPERHHRGRDELAIAESRARQSCLGRRVPCRSFLFFPAGSIPVDESVELLGVEGIRFLGVEQLLNRS